MTSIQKYPVPERVLIAQRGVVSSGENLITKPFNPEQLLLTVRSLLDTRIASA